MSESERIVRKFDPEFRLQAAKLVIQQGMQINKTAEDLGIPVNTLDGWVRKFKSGKWQLGDDVAKSTHAGNQVKPLSADQIKIQDLERQLRRLTMERDVLKKAMAYCVELPK